MKKFMLSLSSLVRNGFRRAALGGRSFHARIEAVFSSAPFAPVKKFITLAFISIAAMGLLS